MSELRDAVFARQPGIEARPLEDGAVLVDVHSGRVFELNRIGAEIWSLLDGVRTLEALSTAVAGRYEAAPEVVATDVERLVHDLVQARLIHRVGLP